MARIESRNDHPEAYGISGISGSGTTLQKAIFTGAAVLSSALSEIFVGTAKTTNSDAWTSSSFGSPANCPTLTFTPTRSGKFRIYANLNMYVSGGTATTVVARIHPTVGSPTVVFSQEGAFDNDTADLSRMVPLFRIDTLTAGVSYTYAIQLKTNANSAYLGNSAVSNGVAIIAEELEF